MITTNINTKELTYLDYARRQLIDLPTLSQNLLIQSYMDDMLRAMVVDLRIKVLAEELIFDKKRFRFGFTATFYIPANWWEHLKRTICYKDHCPNWLRHFLHHRMKGITKHYHQEREVDFTKYATYPKATILFPQLGNPVYKYKLTVESGEPSPLRQ